MGCGFFMKKFLTLTLVFALLFAMVPVVSAAGSVSFKGPDSVRAGDTITLTFSAGGDDIYGGQGTVSYDASQLTLNKYTPASLGGSWKVEITGDKFVFYDDSVSTPLGGTKTIFKVSFTVKELEPGTEISVSASGLKLSDAEFKDSSFGTKTYKATVLPPLSDNCTLATMTVSNADISPAFSPEVTSYSASVPFTTSKLEVEAAAAHPGATVAIKNTSLTAGATTNVTVTVTAENGAKKTYFIRVKRAQDPNYVPSSNAGLSELTVEGFQLSPAFSPDVKQYYVWLPYEADALVLAAKEADSKASVTIGNAEGLQPGRTDIPVTVTAEDGFTQVYTVTAVRAPELASTEDYLSGKLAPVEQETEPTQPETEPTEAPTAPNAPVTQEPQPAPQGLNIVILAGACAACLLLGLLIGGLIFRRRPEYLLPGEEDEPDFMNIPEEESNK